MDLNETATDRSPEAENVADRNVERLLTDAYRPEVPDPAFVEKATAAMHAAARRRAASPVSRGPSATATRLIGWTVAAALLVGVGVILGSGPWGRQGARDSESPERLAGKHDVTAEVPWVAEVSTDPADRGGLTARPRAEAPPIETLAVGEALATAAGQRRRVALEDGSVLYLNQNTTVTLERPRQLALGRGEIFVEVAPSYKADAADGQSPRQRFVVITPDRRITALGTKFDVRAGDEGTRVVVTQGKVDVSGMKLPLLAGQQLDPQRDVGSEIEPPVTAAPRATHVLDWTKELMAKAASPLVPESQHAGGALIAVDPTGQQAKLSLRKYHVDVHIEDGFARTTIDQTYFNHEPQRLEGTFYFPLPPDASLSRLAMYVGGRLMEGGMVEREHGREVFETIMYQRKDPALLEWVDGSTFKMRVFPLEGRQEKRIVLSYTQKLPSLYDRMQYRFPGGHNMQLVGHWSARLRVKHADAVRWESDSHQLEASTEDGDLLLEAEAEKIKPDRDVLLTLYEPPSPRPSARESGRFASAVHEGSRYLMLRWRPELPSQPQRQRRDWVFLFEASADRDPLLARVQVDVIKTLLENAEHDDTFSILTAGTRVHRFAEGDSPIFAARKSGQSPGVAATPENVAKAVKFLEQTHLVGALDLEQALAATGPAVEAAENPVLVHVGSGTAVLGSRDIDALVRRIPKGARYVGVGVGKRWSRTLMKAAAARTGGYFTQINPDEQVTWRALDLLSTLNTPRLLGIKLADKAEQLTFLCHNDSLTQGEDLCAITRMDEGTELPEAVEVTGTLDGKPHSRTIPVADVAEGADYLPRTWAKLEIDRLVALGAVENKAPIIELSKAMYVMSPFTSLLVLENEAMYAQYKVDRGRKDHWALYPCPAEIPVVYEPDPSQPAGDVPEGAAIVKPSAAEVLQTLLVRIPADLLQWPNRPYRSAGQTVPVLYLFNGQYAAQYGYGGMGGFGGFDVMHGAGTMGGMGMNQWGSRYELFWTDFDYDGLDSDGDGLPDRQGMPAGWIGFPYDGRFMTSSGWGSSAWRWGDESREWNGPDRIDESKDTGRIILPGGDLNGLGPVQIEMLEGLDVLVITGHQRDADRVKEIIEQIETLSGQTRLGTRTYPVADLVLPIQNRYLEESMPLRIARQRGAMDALYQIERSHVPFGDEPPIVYPDPDFWERINAHRIREYSSMSLALQGDAQRRIDEALKSPTECEFIETPLADVVEYLKDRHGIEIRIDGRALDDAGLATRPLVTKSIKGISLRSALRLMLRDLGLTYVIRDDVLLITTPEEAARHLAIDDYFGRIAAAIRRLQKGSPPQYLTYQQPSFNCDWHLFHDLLDYAPGMSTSMADVRAVLEAEARPRAAPAAGKIDEKARELIEKARATGWQRATLRGKDGKPLVSVDFDGTGRYRLERTTGSGLREEAICDGTHLWHLYDELGLGARRELSRFHRVELARFVPWALPPAEDLAHGADLVAIDRRTVAIVPPGVDKHKDEDGKPLDYVRLHLLFDTDGRLAERRLVKMPTGEVLLRQTYATDGSVKLLGRDDKVLREWKLELGPCGVPVLKPDETQLVILPLPSRTPEWVQQTRNLKGNYEGFSEEDALAALAGCLASQRSETRDIIARRFFSRGDRRVGFYVLLIAHGHSWDAKQEQNFGNRTRLLCDPLADHPDHPLAQYVAAYLKVRRGQQQEFNLPAEDSAPESESTDGFLRELAQFRDLWNLWNSGRASQGTQEKRDRERHQVIEFIGNCRSPELGWALVSTVRNHGGGKEFYRSLGEAALRFERFPALAYVARYEHARGLLNGGDANKARELFGKLYQETLDRGFLPPIDGSFHQAFHRGQDGPKTWQSMVRRTSAELIADGARAAAVHLAWQIRQVGDQPLAEELLGLALTGTPEAEQLPTTLAAVEYLWHAGQHARADAMLQPLLQNEKYAKSPALWRLAAMVSDARGMTARSLSCTERAMEIEYENLPQVVNLQVIRNDYAALLSRYQQLAAAIATLQAEPPREFLGRVVRVADRWRQVDPDPTAACQTAARIFGDLGAAEMAWDYLTTPLAAKPFEAAPWVSMAEMLRQQGHFELADRAYASAFEAEPTNAQILWDRAQVLLQAGRAEDAKGLFGQLAEGQWQPRFGWLKSQARQYAEKD